MSASATYISEKSGPNLILKETWLTRKPNPWGSTVTALMTFILICVQIIYTQNLMNAPLWLPANHESVFQNKEWWRIWTTLFVHADLGHLLSNSFLFFIFGSLLNGYFGWFIFPFMALIMGGVTQFFVLAGMDAQINLIGISGVVYWMGGTWLILYFLIDQQKSLYQRGLRVIGIALAIFFPTEAFNPRISYQSHLYGFIFGILFGLTYYLWKRKTFLEAQILVPALENRDVTG